MPFTGKATHSAGPDLPELVDDVADLIGIITPFETPLLDHLGDPRRSASGTVHEWIEDALLPHTDRISQATFTPNPTDATIFTVTDGGRFRPGDQVRPEGSGEIMLVLAVIGNALTVQRGYGGTARGALSNDLQLTILSGAALEGEDRPAARFTSRTRRQNYTQIFTRSVEVSGSMLAARAHAVSDEMDYQKQARLRELLRELEQAVIGGVASAVTPAGSESTRRTMNGILSLVETNRFRPGVGPLPDGGGADGDELTEQVLNAALRSVWEQSSGSIDTIVVNGPQKRRINGFITPSRRYAPEDSHVRDLVSLYESDFGVCRVVLSRWVPRDTALLLDASRLDVLPMRGRSFHFKPLASTGDSEVGQMIGEYTLELMNERAHAVIGGLAE